MAPGIFLILWALAAHGPARTETVHIRLVLGVDYVTFDPERTTQAEVHRWMQLSPNVSSDNDYMVAEDVGLCVASDPRYVDCGKNPGSLNVHDALVNIGIIRERIRTLDPRNYPPGLGNIMSYFSRVQRFGLYRDSHLLKFWESGSVAALSAPFDGIEPKAICAPVLDRIGRERSHTAAYQMAWHDWWNCVWGAESKRIGPYPQDAWNCFLAANGIQEKMVYDYDD